MLQDSVFNWAGVPVGTAMSATFRGNWGHLMTSLVELIVTWAWAHELFEEKGNYLPNCVMFPCRSNMALQTRDDGVGVKCGIFPIAGRDGHSLAVDWYLWLLLSNSGLIAYLSSLGDGGVIFACLKNSA